jgi:hypothetical protein
MENKIHSDQNIEDKQNEFHLQESFIEQKSPVDKNIVIIFKSNNG